MLGLELEDLAVLLGGRRPVLAGVQDPGQADPGVDVLGVELQRS